MIILLITLRMVAAQNLFYAVEEAWGEFTIFSKIQDCQIFINEEGKVLYQTNFNWKIGQIRNDIDLGTS